MCLRLMTNPAHYRDNVHSGLTAVLWSDVENYVSLVIKQKMQYLLKKKYNKHTRNPETYREIS